MKPFYVFKRLRRLGVFATVLFFNQSIFGAYVLESPSRELSLTVDVKDEGVPCYNLKYKNRIVLDNSHLGLAGDKIDFARNLRVDSVSRVSVDENWIPVWGQYDSVRNNYNEMAVTFADADDARRMMIIRFRLFDEGLGFRYEFPEQPGLTHWQITDELTEFDLPGNPILYCSPGDYETDEYLYATTPVSALQETFREMNYNQSESKRIENLSVQTPLMIKTQDDVPLYINIHEAALRNYGAMQLDVNDKTSLFKAHIIPDKLGVAAYVKLPFRTPWRTVVVSDDARDILASQLIYNLNEPCALDDTEWITPGKFIGVWWEMFQGDGRTWAYSDSFSAEPGITDYSALIPNGRHPANNDNVKRYIDFAAAHNITGVLVEGWNEGWEDWGAYRKNRHFLFTKPYPDFDVEMLNEYARNKGVRLIMHHETAGNAADYERQLDEAFRFMVDNGYNLVKTGYVGDIIPRSEHHSSQWMNDHYIYVAKRAADYGIMVDSHEAVRPTGLARTYPNWIAQESARGGEYDAFGGNPPEHAAILPFTRLMGGPMDYTPGLFEPHPSHVTRGGLVTGGSTLTKQLALYLTMPSPLQMACDLPENYEKHPDAFRFIEEVPTDWSDSRYLEAEPGDYITVARREKGSERWYVGGITDENARIAKVDCSFLPAGGKYVATIYSDADDAHYITNPTSYKIHKTIVSSKDCISIPVAPGGGFAITLIPQ